MMRILRKNNDEIHREPGVSRRRFFNIGLTFIGKNRFWSNLFRSRFVKSLENTSVFPAALPFARTKNLCFKTARTLKQLIFCLLKMKNCSNTLRVWRFWSEGRRKISYFKAVFPYGGQPADQGEISAVSNWSTPAPRNRAPAVWWLPMSVTKREFFALLY